MVQQGQIDHLLQETGESTPPPQVAAQATLQNYDETYQNSIKDPEGFWESIASELDWFKPWDKVSNGTIQISNGSLARNAISLTTA